MGPQDNQTGGAEPGYFRQSPAGLRGPFSRRELSEQMLAGSLEPDELVQAEGFPIWQRVRVVLSQVAPVHVPLESADALEEELPAWPALLGWAWQRVKHDWPSAPVLGVCLAIGALGLLASRLGWAVWVPWFALVLVGGVMLLLARRLVAGLALTVGSLALPILLLPSSSPSPSAPLAQSATPTPLAGPALSEPLTPVRPLAPPPAPPPPTPVAAATPTATPRVAVAASTTPFQKPLPSVLPSTPPPAPAPASATPVPVPAVAETATPQSRSGALVIIHGEQSAGSGFLAQQGGKVYLFTNNHVCAGMRRPEFTLLDGTRLTAAAVESAAGHDIMRISLKDPPRQYLELAANLERTVNIDDDVLVLGNSGGGGVVTSLEGRVVGIGPDRLEVSAQFIPGNSGSPIIQVSTGRVLGIATYLTKGRDEFKAAGSAPGEMVVRRFGYRLDSVKIWEPVNWGAFQTEAAQVEKITMLTEDIYNFLGALQKKQQPNFATDTLRRPAEDWRQIITRRSLSEVDRKKATQSFLSTLRFMTRSDVTAAETSLHYSFFRERLKRERAERDELYKAFDAQLQRLSAPSMQGR